MDLITAIIWIIVGGTSVAAIYFVYSRLPKKEVMLLRPRDRRGKMLNVNSETDLGLVCNLKKGVVHRFIKAGSSWIFNERGKMITRFIGIEGTAYTAIAKGDELVKIKLPAFLRFMWGDKFYKQIPSKYRRIIETDLIGITVKTEKIDYTEYGLPNLTPADINDEDDSHMLGKLAKGSKTKTIDDVYKIGIGFVLGLAVAVIAVRKGWL